MKVSRQFMVVIGASVVLLSAVLWGKMRAKNFWDGATPAISLSEAVETVLAANPGTAAVDATLKRESNNWAWEVKLDNDLEVYIDANTNQIIKTEHGWNLGDIPLLSSLLLSR